MRFFGRGIIGLALVLISIVLLGCETTTDSSSKYSAEAGPSTTAPTAGANISSADFSGTVLHTQDAITVNFSDLVNPLSPLDLTIKEDGSVTLYFNQKFQFAGKTVGALQEEIRERYVPAYYKNLTVTIKTQDRFYSVGGEVRSPNRYIHTGYMTLTRAIDTAGGFTDFARKGKIQVTRANGKTMNVDYNEAAADSKKDVEIYPNDKITVYKRIF